MSHHVDSAAARADGRVDLCDLYVFDGSEPETTTLIMTVNPDAGRSSPKTFRADALYEFKIDTNGDAVEDMSYRISFGEPDDMGAQTAQVRLAEAAAAQSGTNGRVLGEGRVGETIPLAGGGRAWMGLAGDPFFGNGVALGEFMQTLLVQDRFDPAIFERGGNIFAGRNVTGIVLELPTATLGSGTIGVWMVTSIHDHGAHAQINREATPLMPHLFITNDTVRDAFNEGRPRDDVALLSAPIAALVSKIVERAGTSANPAAYGRQVAQALLPDMQTYQLGTPASYGFAGRNGRRLTDDAMDVVLSIAANQPLSDHVRSANNSVRSFPYLPPPYPESEALPPLNPRAPVMPQEDLSV